MAEAVGEVNSRSEHAENGSLGKRHRVTEGQLRRAEQACKTLRSIQIEVQNAIFDCEHDLRELREREVSPAELLIDGERLIRLYRFLRRRARVIDGILAYLPLVRSHADICLIQLRKLQEGEIERAHLIVPDCGFALVALEQLLDEEAAAR